MNIENHSRNLKESLELIDESIKIGIIKRQRTLGFNISVACADMVEILLHKKDLIDPGFLLKHEWFASERKFNEKVPFDFEGKKELIILISEIEKKRNTLCYRSPQKEEVLKT